MFKPTIPAICFIWLGAVSLFAQSGDSQKYSFGILSDGPSPQNDEIIKQFAGEITILIGGEFDIRFPEDKIITADWTTESVNNAIDAFFEDSEVDIIIAMGIISSAEICRRASIPKPVVAPFVLDPLAQDIPYDNGTSGVDNLCYIISHPNLENDFKMFYEIVPFKKMALVINGIVVENSPNLKNNALSLAEKIGFEIELVKADRTVDEILAAIPDDADAVYFAPLLTITEPDFMRLIQAINERRLPTFSVFGDPDVRKGVLAGLCSDGQFTRRARRTALNIQRILLNEDAGQIPVNMADLSKLTLNMATARAIGIYPSWEIITEAEIIDEKRKVVPRKISLPDVAMEALQVNLEIAAKEHYVAAGAGEVSQAWSHLLPSIEVSGLGIVIDKDRAEASFGTTSERAISGSISASQVLFSEPLLANLSIQKNIQSSREYEHEQLKLNIAHGALAAYLNVLRAKTFEDVQKENLSRTRTHLELARSRVAIGTSGPSEIYRWESQIAQNRKIVIEANSRRNVAEINLNRILHRPIEEPFITEEAGLDDPTLLISHDKFFSYMSDPWSFRMFRAFMVKEGLKSSPELRQLGAAISAGERAKSSSLWAFWSPTVAVSAELTETLSRSGAGSEALTFPDPFASAFGSEKDDTDWFVGLSLSFPLFEGGSKFSRYHQTDVQLKQLELEREVVAEKIEQNIRSAMHIMGASYAGIKQANEASIAANKTLDLVFDSYSRGVLSVIDLIDAQNAALVAELLASNAIYDFLYDYMAVQRAVGGFDIFLSEVEKERWFNKMDSHFENARMEEATR
jgi:outer membrane protein TolC